MTAAERAYYNQRAPEYDDWWLGTGLYAARERPGWEEEVAQLFSALRARSFRRVLDVACGTGFLTRHLRGRVVAADQSSRMLAIARERLDMVDAPPRVVQADALALPFPSGAFDCLCASHFYGHLRPPERQRFLVEARRVAPRILIVDAGAHGQFGMEEVQQRVLKDGSRHAVYKRYFTPEGLLAELGGGTVLHGGHWFVSVLSLSGPLSLP
ncbi:MAG TPA: class I SAM-dependent methyltransferase [Bryobacteraceae bacterium]